MSSAAAAVATPTRIVVRSSIEGNPFKLQANVPPGSNRWNTVYGFTCLVRALRAYPQAVPDDAALRRQKELEEKAHPFEYDNARSEDCWHCGRDKGWPAHANGGRR